MASMKGASSATSKRSPLARIPASRRSVARRWPASQRLNGSLSCCSSTSRSASDSGSARITGAEKPRSSEGTGAASTLTKVKKLLASSSTSTRSVLGSAPRPRVAARWRGHHDPAARAPSGSQGLLGRLAGRGHAVLLEAQGVGAAGRVVAAARRDMRRSGLRVPALERRPAAWPGRCRGWRRRWPGRSRRRSRPGRRGARSTAPCRA